MDSQSALIAQMTAAMKDKKKKEELKLRINL